MDDHSIDHPHNSISHKLNCSGNKVYTLGSATRNVEAHKSKCGSSSLISGTSTNKNYGHQMYETPMNASGKSTPAQSKTRLPLNMIVSKTATRNTLQENEDDEILDFDLTNMRKTKVPAPSWKGKECYRKRQQSAVLYNKRKIEEIQAMKSKLKHHRYDPRASLGRPRLNDNQNTLSEYMSVISNKERCSQPCNNTSAVVPGSDPIPNKDRDQFETTYSSVNNDRSFFTSTPAVKPKDEFVWNPIIVPVANSSGSAKELFEHHYPHLENSCSWLDSPGNYTTSSTSSGLTVAEETVRLTYYAGGSGFPQNHRQRKRDTYDFMSEPFTTSEPSWLSQSGQIDFPNYFEE
ncbi:uncharacterized protein LOC129004152 [Macrosteles quadrilineatus]|uniref:uncharacterized protein LOC129004152 n=1 Tax=Macrosteles quadrilineatus TaxID=74068 RepID=UPI0023E26D06|nr:uncharacterized protein LOC129004152 [Macrosteles quadrilineatus]